MSSPYHNAFSSLFLFQGGKKRAEAKDEIRRRHKSGSLTIELEMLTDGTVSITVVKKKKNVSSSMTKCSEVKSRAKRFTDDADWWAKIELARRIFECIRVRTDKVAKSA
jgi:hypothetical protein